MIRSDGYYLSPANPYEDGIANYQEKGFTHDAYWFNEKDSYIGAFKKSPLDHVEFQKNEFNPSFPNKYVIDGNRLIIHIHTGEEWEFTDSLEIISGELLKRGEKLLKFKSWSN